MVMVVSDMECSFARNYPATRKTKQKAKYIIPGSIYEGIA
jgi:hypothetical protein